ncbi:MAG: type V CRISPR-associated protein Cas4 [Lachnospiraceae bacterium]
MDDAILITELNDFIFCPVSIYFHKLYGNTDKMLYQSSKQIDGTAAHKNVDTGVYSSRKNIFMGTDVYCEKYRLVGKIDIYDGNKKILRERKKKIKQIYDGYVFQVYAQYFALEEMGYPVEKIELYSMDDHKTYEIGLPEQNIEIFRKFEDTVNAIREFQIQDFVQTNSQKCKYCIYEPACDRSLI